MRVAAGLAVVGVLLSSEARAQQAAPEKKVATVEVKRTPASFDVEILAAGGLRIGGSQSFDVESRANATLGAGAWYSPTPWVGLGLEYDHTWLGNESIGPGDAGEIEVSRNLNALFAGLRIFPLRRESAELWLALGAGLVWQSEDATGLVVPGMGQVGQPFACSGTDSMRIGLRGGAGTAIALGGGMHLAPEILVEGDQLTSDAFGGCVAGPGSVGVVSFRLGFFYRADVTRYVR